MHIRLMLAALMFVSLATPLSAQMGTFTPGEVLVIPSSHSPLQMKSDRRVGSMYTQVNQVLLHHGLERYEYVSPPNSQSSFSTILRLISSREDFDPVAAARDLRETGEFRAAIPNYHLKLVNTLPNDPHLPDQVQITHPVGHINLDGAWDTQTGDSSVVIGIVDTGVDIGHPDLINRIWHNWGEIQGNLIDDDGNGYVDDWSGWDFGNNDNDPNPHAVFEPILGLDLGFHGTAVAATAAAQGNNGIGMSGSAWDVRIMPLKIVDNLGLLTTASMSAAFTYAADNGCDIVNVSSITPPNPGVTEFFNIVIGDLTAAGVLCVAAAGNDSTNVQYLPASIPECLSVGATDTTNSRAWFSTHGPHVNVSAPGERIFSAICRNYVIDITSQIYYQILFGYSGLEPYMYHDGTSFSTPIVAGVAALVKSQFPAMTPAEIEAHLIATGDSITTDFPIGVKVNAANAMMGSAVDVSNPGLMVGLRIQGVAPNPFNSRTSIRFTLPETGHARLALFDVTGRRVVELVNTTLAAGIHAVNWDGREEGGSRVASGVYFARLESGGVATTERMVLFRQ